MKTPEQKIEILVSALKSIREKARGSFCFDEVCFNYRDVESLAKQGGDICDWTMIAIESDDALKDVGVDQ